MTAVFYTKFYEVRGTRQDEQTRRHVGNPFIYEQGLPRCFSSDHGPQLQVSLEQLGEIRLHWKHKSS
jgi:hypothetical protein